MINPEEQYQKVIALLNEHNVVYKLFTHRAAFTYEDLAIVQKETGFFGTEAKCMVLQIGEGFIVYVTLQGKRLNMDTIKNTLGVNKIKLATAEQLQEYFGAVPGCAYPFGFAENIAIFVDPQIYKEEWLLFSPVLPTATVQAKGMDLKKIFENLPNKITEVSDFNQ